MSWPRVFMKWSSSGGKSERWENAAIARCGRDALIESGRIAERIYLAAGALGLRACNLAAFTDDSLNRLLGLDGGSRVVLHLTVFGR